jgi:transposase
MVYQHISNDRKERALYLLLEQEWEVDRIVEALGLSVDSINRWEANYTAYGTAEKLSGLQRRPRILTSRMTEDLYQLITECPSLLLNEIGEWLAIYHDQPISTTALHDNLKDLGLTYKLLKRAAAERDDAYRAEWLQNVTANYTADQLVFLGESSKDDRTILRKYGRAPSGEDAVDIVALDHGIRYSILPALTIDGYMAIRVVEGSIDGVEFYDFAALVVFGEVDILSTI